MNSTADAHTHESRLRKNRNRFTVQAPPTDRMSNDPRIDPSLFDEPTADLDRFTEWFLDQDDVRDRFRWTLRDSLDELLDGQRTGRWCYQHLTKTEKTYLGTAIEINLTKEFEIEDGEALDWRISGQDLDCKFSKDFGGWEIPLEMYKSPDNENGEDRAALLLWMDDDNCRWAAGLIRISDDVLRVKADGTPAYNRDFKRRLSTEGVSRISWLWDRIQNDLPDNLLLQMRDEQRDQIFERRSGQQRVNALFREMAGCLVNRATVLTVAQQDDPLKRARDTRLTRNLGKEGFLVLGHQDADPHIAQLLGLPVPTKGEFVSCRIAPTDIARGRRVWLADRWWAIAGDADPVVAAPPGGQYRKSSRDELENGTNPRQS